MQEIRAREDEARPFEPAIPIKTETAKGIEAG